MAAVRRYIDAFNRGDVDALAAACADPMQILDGMAPHVWQGPTATRDWWRDVLADGEHVGASGYHVTLGEPRHVDVKGEFGYVVVPTTMAFDLNGQRIVQKRGVFTVALQNGDAGWRLTAWTWSKGVNCPA